MSKIENPIILHESNESFEHSRIEQIITDGFHSNNMMVHLISTRGQDTANHIISNARNAVQFFANPLGPKSNSKILCLGKVQSGKTAFFITTISLAFDNGYDICFLFGGTKNNLLDQNIDRLKDDFSNNEQVKIVELRNTNVNNITNYISCGYKVIIVVLKNVSSEQSNLYLALDYANKLKHLPTIIIDDESDEHTPGAPQLKSKNPKAGITHDVISDFLDTFDIVTMLFVTATPHANLLISRLDDLSPDYAVLVEPGNDYTGGDAFHDFSSNSHVQVIADSDDFIKSIPESYKKALKFFMLGSSIMFSSSSNDPYTMLVHPSGLTKIHRNVVEKISDDLIELKEVLSNSNHPAFETIIDEFRLIFQNDHNSNLPFALVMDNLIKNLESYRIYEYNTTESGRKDIESILNDKKIKYKIFVGGNMLGRGVTLPNLCVTYMYRDSKISAVDTLYQRARWFGYKRKYFDICRVYMTQNLKDKFIAVADSERDLWISLSEFLSLNISIKEFKRIFSLPHDKLILTRQSVSKTITFERVKPGFTYDKSILYREEDVKYNNHLIKNLIEDKSLNKQVVNFASGDYQLHLVIQGKYSSIFESFISKYRFQKNSILGPNSFKKIYDQVLDGQVEDKMTIIIMRYKTGEFRSLSMQGFSVKELPQGYDPGTGYPGDKSLTNYENILHIQVHLVFTQKNSSDKIIPLLALNNPLTKYNIRYATGDAYYDQL